MEIAKTERDGVQMNGNTRGPQVTPKDRTESNKTNPRRLSGGHPTLSPENFLLKGTVSLYFHLRFFRLV